MPEAVVDLKNTALKRQRPCSNRIGQNNEKWINYTKEGSSIEFQTLVFILQETTIYSI